MKLAARICDVLTDELMTATGMARVLDAPITAVRARLYELQKAGLVRKVGSLHKAGTPGRPAHVWGLA